jgi:hypothetical protein
MEVSTEFDDYREVFPLWCGLDILDAHDYREDFFRYSVLRGDLVNYTNLRDS